MKNLDFELVDFGILAGSFTGSPLLKSTRASNQKLTAAGEHPLLWAANLTKLKVPQM
jgi:hypothetical protein